jgi:hypothetical protein
MSCSWNNYPKYLSASWILIRKSELRIPGSVRNIHGFTLSVVQDEDEIKAHMDSHEICMVFSCKHCNYQVAYITVIPGSVHYRNTR